MQKIQLDNTNSHGDSRGPSEVVSHYLEAIYYIWAEGESVKSARLADWLRVSRPTVTVALRRMTRDGMVRFNARKDIELTAKGRRMAEAIVRRHRIMERWLTDALGLDWVTADAEAARLEHAVSEVVEKRLYKALGRPQTCPHGNPIPGYSEAVAREVRLASLGAGDRASISRVSEVAEREAPRLLAYLHERNLVPGREVRVLEVDHVAKTLRLQSAKHKFTLSYEATANNAAMSGVTRALTNAVITSPNAAAMTTATARSTTFPRNRNVLKPFIAELLSLLKRRTRQHDLPELLRSVEPGQRGLHVRQRVDAVHHRSQATIDCFEHGLKLACVPHCRSKQTGVAEKNSRHGDFRFDSRRRSARDDASADRQ